MDIIDESKATISALSPAWVGDVRVAVDMLRLDLIHPVISGNKWYKLKHNLQHAKERGYSQILSFGGAYSNHLVAAAGAARAYGIAAIGIVRGNDGGEPTPTLKECEELGMQLHFVSREEYAKKNDAAWLDELSSRFGNPFIIPEGGANEWGRRGAEEIGRLIPEEYSHVCVSLGTGTTFTGLRNALPVHIQMLGFIPMKGGLYLADEVASYLNAEHTDNWQLFDRWHVGGFGKSTDALVKFMNEFYEVNQVPLDVVYTAKMMYGVKELLTEGFFADGAKILCVHTGGLQGNASFEDKLIWKA